MRIYAIGMYLILYVLMGTFDNYKAVFKMVNLLIDLALLYIALAGYLYSMLAETTFCVGYCYINNVALKRNIWSKYCIFLAGVRWEDVDELYEQLSFNVKSDVIEQQKEIYYITGESSFEVLLIVDPIDEHSVQWNYRPL